MHNPLGQSNNFHAREERDGKTTCGICFREMSEEEAEKLLAEILASNSKWQEERFHKHHTITVDGIEVAWSDEYYGQLLLKQ